MNRVFSVRILTPESLSIFLGTSNYHCDSNHIPHYDPPRFSVSIFFLIIFFFTCAAVIAFLILYKTGAHQHDNSKVSPDSEASEARTVSESSESKASIQVANSKDSDTRQVSFPSFFPQPSFQKCPIPGKSLSASLPPYRHRPCQCSNERDRHQCSELCDTSLLTSWLALVISAPTSPHFRTPTTTL